MRWFVMKIDSVDIEKVSPMMKEYIKTKRENKDVIIFYRLGDFYEMFFLYQHCLFS